LDSNYFIFDDKYYFIENSLACLDNGFYVLNGAFYQFTTCFEKILFGYFKYGFLNSVFYTEQGINNYPFYIFDTALSNINIKEPLNYFLGFPFYDNILNNLISIYNDIEPKINDYFDIKKIHIRLKDYFSAYISTNLNNSIFVISKFSFDLFLSILNEDQEKFKFIIDNTSF